MLNKHAKDKIYGYVTKALGLRPYRRGWLKGDCPFCGKKDKFGVNIGMNRTNCFICGNNFSPINLITELEGFSTTAETWKFLKTYDGLSYIEPAIDKVEKSDVIFPDGYTNITLGSSMLARKARKYIKGRGFDIDEAALKGWGYCTSGDYFGYLILPFYLAGKLVYFNGRRLMGNGPKYQNPKLDDFGVGKSTIIYNMDALAIYEDIFIVEGVFNADTLGDNALATGGKKIASYQISMVNKSDVQKVTILLDPDAYDDAIKLAMEFAFHKEIKIVLLPEEKDVNDLGRDTTMEFVKQNPWLNYNDLLKMKHEHEKRTRHTHY